MRQMKHTAIGVVLLAILGQLSCVPAPAAPTVKSGKTTYSKTAAPVRTGRDYSKPFSQYANMVYKKVYSVWDYAEGKNSVVLTVVVDQDGTLGDISTSSSPKNENAERAASAALTQAQPLGPLPTGSSPKAKLIMTFNSSSDQHNSNATLLVKMEPIEGATAPAAPKAVSDPTTGDLVPGASPSN
jgi:TonB family protein